MSQVCTRALYSSRAGASSGLERWSRSPQKMPVLPAATTHRRCKSQWFHLRFRTTRVSSRERWNEQPFQSSRKPGYCLENVAAILEAAGFRAGQARQGDDLHCAASTTGCGSTPSMRSISEHTARPGRLFHPANCITDSTSRLKRSLRSDRQRADRCPREPAIVRPNHNSRTQSRIGPDRRPC